MQRTPARFPAPIRRFTTIQNSSSKGFSILFYCFLLAQWLHPNLLLFQPLTAAMNLLACFSCSGLVELLHLQLLPPNAVSKKCHQRPISDVCVYYVSQDEHFRLFYIQCNLRVTFCQNHIFHNRKDKEALQLYGQKR